MPCMCGDPECPSCGAAQGTLAGADWTPNGTIGLCVSCRFWGDPVPDAVVRKCNHEHVASWHYEPDVADDGFVTEDGCAIYPAPGYGCVHYAAALFPAVKPGGDSGE